MASSSDLVKREFLYVDENVPYYFDINNDQLTIKCDHPIFISRFKSDSKSIAIDEFFKTAHKGNDDYDFFEKMNISLREYLLDNGGKR